MTIAVSAIRVTVKAITMTTTATSIIVTAMLDPPTTMMKKYAAATLKTSTITSTTTATSMTNATLTTTALAKGHTFFLPVKNLTNHRNDPLAAIAFQKTGEKILHSAENQFISGPPLFVVFSFFWRKKYRKK